MLRDWFFNGRNNAGGAATFDGALVGGAGGVCLDLASAARNECKGPGSHGAKVISLLPQTDVEWDERGEHPDYRVIEIAGGTNEANTPTTA